MKKLLTLVSMTIFLLSCNKDDNEGGNRSVGKASFNGKVHTKTIEVNGTLPNGSIKDYRYNLWKGTQPSIMYFSNPDSSVDIAWLNGQKGTVEITKIDSEGNKTDEFTLKGIPKLNSLLGFTKIPTDNSYAIAYGVTKKYKFKKGNEARVPEGEVRDIGVYYIAKFDALGNNLFNNNVFGDGDYHTKKHGGRFNPGVDSTGRLVYDKRLGVLMYFVGVNKRTKATQIHQCSTFGWIDTKGKDLGNKGWHLSHNFEQRILFDETASHSTFLFSHCDRGPFGMVIGCWNFEHGVDRNGYPMIKRPQKAPLGGAYDKTVQEKNKQNVTNFAFGDVVGLGNGEFVSVYARSKDNFTNIDFGYKDIYFRKIETENGISQDRSKNRKITNVGKNQEHNGIARVAKFGDNVIVAWHNDKKPYAYVGEYDVEGNVLVEPEMKGKVLLNRFFGFITLPNGNVFWASSEQSSSTLNLNWIKK